MSRRNREIPSRLRWRPYMVGLSVVAIVAVGLWWYTGPWRWARQAASLVSQDPASADALADAALAAGTTADSSAWLTRCRAQLALGKPLEALGAYSQIREPGQCDPVAWCDLLKRAQDSEHFVLMDLSASAALKIPLNRRCLLTLALPIKVGMLPEPEESRLIDELRAFAGNDAAAWRSVGRVGRLRGHLAASVSAYEKAVALSAINELIGRDSRRELAQLLVELGQFDAAKPLVLELQQALDGDADLSLLAARIRHSERDFAGVQTLLDRLLLDQPNHMPARLLSGILHVERESLDDAIVDFQICIRLNPHFPEAHYRLAQAYLRRGDAGAATGHLAEHKRLAALQRELLNAQRRRELAPQSPALLGEIGGLYQQLGQPRTAEHWRRAADALRRVQSNQE